MIKTVLSQAAGGLWQVGVLIRPLEGDCLRQASEGRSSREVAGSTDQLSNPMIETAELEDREGLCCGV